MGGSRNLTAEEARALCETLLGGGMSDQAIADVLVMLAEKGETPEEVSGFVHALLAHAERIPFDGATVDTCGTGGSGLARFNVSTSVAFVLAACGVCVAKHGNRGSRAPNGSFDLLEALGIPIDLGGSEVAECLERTGLGFIYARRFHPLMQRVAAARALAQRRTVFNLAGPLSNPTRVRVQVVGTATGSDARTVAGCLRLLGREQGVCVTGHSGIDEVDLSGPAVLCGIDAGLTSELLDPRSLGLSLVAYAEMPGGDAPTNARLFLELLDGTAPVPLAEAVYLSAALVLVAAGRVASYRDGIQLARDVLARGRVREKFVEYRDVAVDISRRTS